MIPRKKREIVQIRRRKKEILTNERKKAIEKFLLYFYLYF